MSSNKDAKSIDAKKSRHQCHMNDDLQCKEATSAYETDQLAEDTTASKQRPSRIAFGSCNNQKLPQPLWSVIESRHPSAFVWGGDAIYADHLVKTNYKKFPPQPIIESATPERLNRYYAIQKEKPGYQSLLRTNLTVFGTIDDHDMGANNADQTYSYKKKSGVEFLKFTGEPIESPMMKRAQDGLGVYGVKVFDFDKPFGQQLVSDEDAAIDPDVVDVKLPPSWNYSNKSVAIFVLDSRSNRTPWSKSWDLNDKGDFFGERQWTWFETAIRRSRASVNVIVQGMQVHTYRWPDGNGAEEWSKFPRARQRLYNTLLQEGIEAPILISGDVHMAQFMRKDCYMQDDSDDDGLSIQNTRSRPLIEVTTSGMTHSWGTYFGADVKYHTAWYGPYYQLASRTFMNLAHFVCPWTEILIADDANDFMDTMPKDCETNSCSRIFENGGAEGAKSGKQYALDLNFGEMEFDWVQRIITMRIIGRNAEDPPLLSAQWRFDQLSGRSQMIGSTHSAKELLDAHIVNQAMGTTGSRNWICINHRGIPSQAQVKIGYMANSVALVFFISFPYIFLILFVLFLAKKCIKFHAK